MGEQYIDLFTAGAYALCGRIYAALAGSSLAWLFYTLAAIGLLFAMLESAIERRPDLWLRHLAAISLSAVLTLLPQSIDLTELTYGAPGQVETLFGTRTGAAPHLTYWIERLGATTAVALSSLLNSKPVLEVPGVTAQVANIASDPASLNDNQVKANLEIWRRRIVPEVLHEHPGLAAQIDAAGLSAALLDPTPAAPQFVGAAAARRAAAVRAMLVSAAIDLPGLLQAQSPMLNSITQAAGASDWDVGAADGASPSVRFAQRTVIAPPLHGLRSTPAFDDALERANAVSSELQAQLPQADQSIAVGGADQLYDMLGRSILYVAGVTIERDAAARAAIGSLCQRSGDAACRGAMAPLIDASTRLRVNDADQYNTMSTTTWLAQPITSLLLTITSVMLGTLASLVVSALPFALGVAKSIAILVSIVGAWLLLWPGRARIALSWMVGPISFVSLWSVLFNLWSEIEPSLARIASIVGDADYGSWSATRAMSIAISLGYMGLPALALGIVYGESGRALYHASARLETALLMAWHTRGSIAAFSRRWLVNSPLARRWNQRAYRAVGLGPLPSSRGSRAAGAAQARTAAAPVRSGARTAPRARPAPERANGPPGQEAGAAGATNGASDKPKKPRAPRKKPSE